MTTTDALTYHRRMPIVLSWVFLISLAVAAQVQASSEKMAFAANVNGNWDIFVASLDGGAPVQITDTLYDESEPCWSPDHQKITYSASDGKLYMVDLASKETQELAAADDAKKKTSPCFSPDGQKIVYVRLKGGAADDTELAIFDLRARTWRTLIDQPGPQFDPDWSPDGKYVVYTTVHCTAACGRIIQELWLCSSLGNYARQILMTNSHCMKPRWSPNGRQIAFCSDKGGSFDIWTVSLDDWNLEQNVTDMNLDTCPDWAPGGNALTFISARTGKMGVWVKNLKTEVVQRFDPFIDGDIECRDVTW